MGEPELQLSLALQVANLEAVVVRVSALQDVERILVRLAKLRDGNLLQGYGRLVGRLQKSALATLFRLVVGIPVELGILGEDEVSRAVV